MQKTIKMFTLLAFALLFTINSYAQREQRHHRAHQGMSILQLADELKLTEEQQSSIEAIEEKYREKREAIKESASEDRAEAHEAMKELMQQQKAEITALLTPDQKAALKAKKAALKEKHLEMREDIKDMHEEMKAYRTQHMEPVLKAQRAKLEPKISAEDKATIAALRAKKAEHKATLEHKRERTPELRKEMREERAAHKEEFRQDRETIKALTTKYAADIEPLFAEIKPQSEKWHQDLQAIAKKHHAEHPELDQHHKGKRHKGKKQGDRRQEHREGAKAMHKAHFLLLEPATTAPTPATTARVGQVRVYPNPAVDRNTLEYTLLEAGLVTVELRSKEGQVIQVVSTKQQAKGTYTTEVDLSALQGGVYYLTITSGEETRSQKFVVSK